METKCISRSVTNEEACLKNIQRFFEDRELVSDVNPTTTFGTFTIIFSNEGESLSEECFQYIQASAFQFITEVNRKFLVL